MNFGTVDRVPLIRNPAQLDIRLNQRTTPARAIDKGGVACTARESLDPDRSRTRTQIEKSRVLNAGRDHVEECFTKAIGCGPHIHRWRALEISSLVSTGNYPHFT